MRAWLTTTEHPRTGEVSDGLFMPLDTTYETEEEEDEAFASRALGVALVGLSMIVTTATLFLGLSWLC